jgi:eukaryotic-like serine/threonine-protein kinase
MNEFDLFTEALNRTDPTDRAAYLNRACAGNPELRRRLEELLAGHARAENPLDRPPVAAGEFGATVGQPTPCSTGACPPEGATEAFDLTHADAKSALGSARTASLTIDPTEHGPPAGATATSAQPNTDAATAAEVTPRAARVAIDERLGTTIAGRYTLVDLIGEGGMGSVYLASQTEPVKRQVALKLIKTGMDSRGVLARFDAERQALAMMDHPNIARIYDGGVTPSGRPYFVMELVKGVPLTEYCDTHRLTVKARLELFVAVCQAVQHAHQKGIIHRDLKPGNVMVTEVDGRPTPKVIDFGVAKATEVKLTDLSIADIGAIVGTPAYMSPEQADPSSMDIDTRTDVYAMGVILYELLVGSTPLNAKEFRRGAVLEILRMVREVDPPRPSTKLSTADGLPNIAANRSIEPARLAKLFQGELDWVVMKALEKDRDRRYDTANGFARDIQRYLADEVVEARPPSRGYRLKKFVRRNKIQVIAASLIFITLSVGMSGTVFGMIRAEQRRREAERNLAFARKGNEILGSVFAGLDPEKIAESGRPLHDVLRENLVKAVKELEGSAIGDPLEVAAMQYTLGESLIGLGEFDLAVEVLEKARATRKSRLGPDHPDTLTSMNQLGIGYQAAQKLDKALPLHEETLALRKSRLGPDHPDTLQSMGNLAVGYWQAEKLEKALPLLEETVSLRKSKLGPDHPDTLTSMANLALGYRDAGKLDKALPLLEETMRLMKSKLGPDHPKTLISMGNLALGYRQAGKPDKALPLFEETLALMKSKLGPDHPNTLTSMGTLALGYQDVKKLDKALPLFEETLALKKSKLGPDHPATLIGMNNLASGYQDAKKLDKALPLFEETLALTKSKFGPDHREALRSMGNLAMGYRDAGKLDKALPLLEETVPLLKSKLGPDHPTTLAGMSALALGYQDVKKLDKALPLFEETLALMKSKLGPDHPTTLTSMNNLAMGYKDAKRLEKALPLFEETLALRKSRLGPDHPDTLQSMGNLAVGYWLMNRLDRSIPLCEDMLSLSEKKLGRDHADTILRVANLGVNYRDAGRLAEAIPLLEEAYHASKKHPGLGWVEKALLDAYTKVGENPKLANLLQDQLPEARKTLPKDSPELTGMFARIGKLLLLQKKWTEAEPLLRECLAIREKSQPDLWSTFNTQSLLGGALLGQKKYAEAEPLLRKGYEGMKAREKTIPPIGAGRIPEALDRLIELSTATNKLDDVKKWQAERTKYPTPSPTPGEKK